MFNDLLLNSQAHILIEIEGLVNAISAGTYPYCRDNLNCYGLPSHLTRYLSVYHPNYDYSEHLTVFWLGCQQAGIFPNSVFIWPEQILALVQFISVQVKSDSFRRKAPVRRYQTKQNCQSIQQYASALHDRYSRLLVVRVDLYYRMEAQSRVGIHMVYQHLDQMAKALYTHHDIFAHRHGHAWCLEQGATRGYHIHSIYYFDGSKHQNDWYKAQQIGELWSVITGGLGAYHSCNTTQEKAKYESRGMLGVGMIHRNDTEACQNSVHVASYLADAEKDQYLRMRPSGRRAFATGK